MRTARHRLRLAETTAEQIGLSLSNLRLRRSLEEQSIKDPLSGLYNRRHFEESLERELALAERKNTPLVLAMMDIDHFKRYNDTHGHQAGDQVIERLGRCLRSRVRESDIACRWGGEEFIILLPETDAVTGHERLDELRRAVAELEFSDGERRLPGITISIGMACRPEHGHDADTLIKAADRALYQAKREGRDRVVVASPPEERDEATDNSS